MPSRENLALLVRSSVAGLVGAAAVFAFVRFGFLDSETEGARKALPGPLPEFVRRTDQFSLSNPAGSSQPPATSSEAPLRPTIVPEPDNSVAWSTEIRPEATVEPSRWVTLLPSLHLPWQTAKPAAPQRSYTVKSRVAELSPAVNVRLAARFEAAQAPWPPAEIALIGIKDEKVLELHARASGGEWRLVHRYRVLAASGGAGPKLRQGDRKVPEGIYGITELNPNSAYHVSLRVGYPNSFDRQMAARDGRSDLGGDIMIHGKNLSAGCLAMGDEAIEELFVLAAQVGVANITLVIAPTDFRQNGLPAIEAGQPQWVPELYAQVASAMSKFKAPPSRGLLSFFDK